MIKNIKVRGARQHNLKNINVDIPKDKLVVFTGVSGSGKSSLAFDTIYAEGQRRYVESLSTYARQFLGIMEKPDVDYIEGLSPAISIDQKTTSKNPRSTVGTITEIYDYFRLLFARIGHPHCPICGREIESQSVDQIVQQILDEVKRDLAKRKIARYLVLSPVVRDKKGTFTSLFDNLKAKGFTQVRVDGFVKDLDEEFLLFKTNKHNIDVITDRVSIGKNNIKDKIAFTSLKARITNSVEQSLNLSDGLVVFSRVLDKGFEMPKKPKEFSDHLYSEKFACPVDNIQLPEIEPRTFSFNSPSGACPQCEGIGKILKVQPNLLFSEELTITEGGILPFSNMFENDTWYSRLILRVCEMNGIDTRIPIKHLTKSQKKVILYGTTNNVYKVEGENKQGRRTSIYEKFNGVIGELERRHANTQSNYVRSQIQRFMKESVCPKCEGDRLKKEALSITIEGKSIAEVTRLSVVNTLKWVNKLSQEPDVLSLREENIAHLILSEIAGRLTFLSSVGLEYLTLSRPSGTLSGGESQRIRLASQIGSGLTGVLYILDEPTIGLHQRDNQRLINTLKDLRDLGNTIIVVEHDSDMIKQSDWVIDFGPGAGKFGGAVVANGTPRQLGKSKKSLTGKYISGKKKIKTWSNNSLLHSDKSLTIYGCSQFNLKDIDVVFPLGKLICITGVSGSGKSSLLVETLYPALVSYLNPFYNGEVGLHKRIEGAENIDKVILIDQSPIGRTPRSNPATYTKVFDHIRDVYALTRDAKLSGFNKGRFSFNVKGGRCENCDGQGQIKIEMQFMGDIWIVCEVCKGSRYNSQTLDVEYKGKNVSEVLKMTVNEAEEFFHNHPKIVKKLDTLKEVGLGYIELGQPATTLSGGEAQRVKLSSELSKKDTGNTAYILDEPSTGLHFADLEKLLKVLRILVDRGNTVFLIEHNLDAIKNADWIIDLGPEGGDGGGKIVAEGTLEQVKKSNESYTGQFMKRTISRSATY